MYLHTIRVQGFKRLVDVSVQFNGATFLIGQNNCGKSSLLKAIEYLLSNKQIGIADFYSEKDPDSGESVIATEKVTMTAEFRNVSLESNSWKGFKGRTYNYDIEEGSNETGISIIYKKEWEPGKAPTQFLKAYERVLKDKYSSIKKIEELIQLGVSEQLVLEAFDKTEGNISSKLKEKLDYLDDLWDLTENETFFKNPGGIPGNVLSRLPRYLLIPAEAGEYELSKSSGTLQKTLKELFKEVRDSSQNYEQAQSYLNSLATELDPQDKNSDFGQMLSQLNDVMTAVFPESSVHVNAN